MLSLLIKIFIVFLSNFIQFSLQEDWNHSCTHDLQDLSSMIAPDFLSTFQSKYGTRKLQGSQSKSIRITTDINDIPSENMGVTREYIESLFEAISIYMNHFIEVIPRQEAIRNFSGSLKCLSYTYPSYFQQPTGVTNSDFHIFITFGDTVYAEQLPFLGWWCELDPNPVAAVMYLNYKIIAQNMGLAKGFKNNFKSLLHQFIHIFGFSEQLYPYWIDYSTKLPYDYSKIFSEDQTFGENIQTHQLKSFNIKMQANYYYDCSTSSGMLLENKVYQTERQSHWEFDLVGNELMTQNTLFYSIALLSEMTVALLKDTGYYAKVNSNMVRPLFWGKAQNCDFQKQGCLSNISYEEFPLLNGQQCDFFQLGFNIPQSDTSDSECLIVKLKESQLCENDIDNIPDENNRMNTGATSRCFVSNAYKVGQTPINNYKCLKATCNQSATLIQIFLWAAESIQCTQPNQVIDLSTVSSTTAGTLTCPTDFQRFCNAAFNCKGNCSQNGFCNKGICFCLSGYSGDDCSIKCDSNTVLDNSICVSACSSGKYLTPSNDCQVNCPKGFYGDVNSQKCQICHPFCEQCTGPSSIQCQGCNFPYIYTPAKTQCSDKKCDSSCLTCFGTSSNECISCIVGMFVDYNNSCNPCNAECQECEDTSSKCLSCSTAVPGNNYIFDVSTHTCTPTCHQTCLTCAVPNNSSQCLSCKDGQFLSLLSHGSCINCFPPCKKCSSSTMCLLCEDGYIFDPVKKICQLICHPSCKLCKKSNDPTSCIACFSGYYVAKGICNQCTSPCKTCIATSQTCFSCIDDHTLDLTKQVCNPICDVSCTTCSVPYNANACVSCPQEYYLTSAKTCEKCQSPCLSCTKQSYLCLNCINNNYTYDSITQTCNSQCHQSCETCLIPNNPDSCLQCKQGYFALSQSTPSKCGQCKSPCSECTEFEDQCLDCIDGYQKNNNTCIAICHPSCETCNEPYNSLSCNSCYDGYYLVDNKCLKCQSPCKLCQYNIAQGIIGCTECEQEYSLVDNNRCIFGCHFTCKSCDKLNQYYSCTSCQSGYQFVDNDQINLTGIGICQQCASNCEVCDKISCQQCKDGYEFDIKGNCAECDQSCQTCFKPSDGQACLTCNSSNMLDKSNKCIHCQSGYYFSSSEQQCVKCSDYCISCSSQQHCDICQEGYIFDNQHQSCNKLFQCHFSCQQCRNTLYSACYSCVGNRNLYVLNQSDQTGMCDCPSGTTDVGEQICQQDTMQQTLVTSTKLTFIASTSLITLVSILNSNPVIFFVMLEFSQSISFLSYLNYKPLLGLDGVMNQISYSNLSKFKVFDQLFPSDSDVSKRVLEDGYDYEQMKGYNNNRILQEGQDKEQLAKEQQENNQNMKFKLNEKTNSFLANSLLIIGINLITWIFSGYFSLLKVKKNSSFLLKVKRLFCISAPVAIFTVSSQEFSLLIFMQLRTLNYGNTIQILNLFFSILSLVYFGAMLFYLTFQLEYQRKVIKKSRKYQLDTSNKQDFSQIRSRDELKMKNYSKQDLSQVHPSRHEIFAQRRLKEEKQQSQNELAEQREYQNENENNNSNNNKWNSQSTNEKSEIKEEKEQRDKMSVQQRRLYLIYKYVRQENWLTRNFIQITVIRKVVISLASVGITVNPIAQMSVQLLGYVIYSIYLIIFKPLRCAKSMLIMCITDCIITLLHIVYIIMIAYEGNSRIVTIMSSVILLVTVCVFLSYFTYSIYILVKLFYIQVYKCIHRNQFISNIQLQQLPPKLPNTYSTIIQINQSNPPLPHLVKTPHSNIILSSQKFILSNQSNQMSPPKTP